MCKQLLPFFIWSLIAIIRSDLKIILRLKKKSNESKATCHREFKGECKDEGEFNSFRFFVIFLKSALWIDALGKQYFSQSFLVYRR